MRLSAQSTANALTSRASRRGRGRIRCPVPLRDAALLGASDGLKINRERQQRAWGGYQPGQAQEKHAHREMRIKINKRDDGGDDSIR